MKNLTRINTNALSALGRLLCSRPCYWRYMYKNFIPILIAIVVLTLSNYANACSGPRYEGKQAYENALRVFRVKILNTELVNEKYNGNDFELVNAKYELLESFKGNVDKNGIVKFAPFSPGNCSFPLLTGSEYVIYLREDDFVFDFNGSWSYLDSENTKTAEELEKIREYAKKDM